MPRSVYLVAGTIVTAAAAIGAPLARAQQASSLGPRRLRAHEPFSRIAGVETLADGRLVVVDSRDQALRMVSTTGEVAPLGRTGGGPNEYRRPFGVFRRTGDTLYVYDSGERRFLRVAPNGSLAGTVTLPAMSVGRGYAPPHGADSLGRVYWDVIQLDQVPDGFRRRQQLTIVRWQPGQAAVEDVAQIDDHDASQHALKFIPLPFRDGWSVTPGGELLVARATKYRLDRIVAGGAVVRGAEVGDPPMLVTSEIRDSVRQRAINAPAASIRMTGSAGRPQQADPARMRRDGLALYADESFPRFMPPIPADWAVRTGPNGTAWVTRTTAPADSITPVDVFDRTGHRIRRFALPPHGRLVGVGAHAVYIARTDDDGLEWLEVYAPPR